MLMNKFQSYIWSRNDHSIIIVFFDTFFLFCILDVYFACSILFGMTGYDSDFPTYPLHYLILCSSTTDRWESQIHCPSYRIKSSKVEDLVIVTVFCVETRRNWYKINSLTVERLVRMGRKNYYKYSTQDLGASLYSHL